MLFARIFVISALVLLANSQSTTTDATTPCTTAIPVYPAVVPAVVITSIPTAVQSYMASVMRQSEYTPAIAALESAMPDSLRYQTTMIPLGSWPLAGEAPSWMSAMPASYVSYVSSFMAVELELMTRPAKGPAPTNRPRVEIVGAALAVGAAGLALL